MTLTLAPELVNNLVCQGAYQTLKSCSPTLSRLLFASRSGNGSVRCWKETALMQGVLNNFSRPPKTAAITKS
jgi:hypothetical protein